MALEIRQLRPEDAENLFLFWSQCKPLWKTLDTKYLSQKRSRAILNDTRYCYAAAIVDQQIQMTLASYAWRKEPYHTLFDFKTTETLGINQFKSYLGQLCPFILKQRETEGRKIFWYAIPYNKVSNNITVVQQGGSVLESWIPDLKKYQFENNQIIAAGTRPDDPFYRALWGKEPHNFDIVIRKGQLIV